MERADRTRKALTDQRDALEKDPLAPVAGNPRGDVTVVEFFDYSCGYCKRVAPALEALKAADPNVRVVYKEFPILGPGSVFAARAALAAHRQGKYEPLHRALMQADALDEAVVRRLAAEVGLDVARLEKDMEAPEVMQALQGNQQLAAALDIGGTPAFVIGERLVPGAVGAEALQALVNQERERRKGAR
jgi:protein-disulfide isomerase